MAQAESTWVPGSVPRFTHPKTVIHPGTNPTRRSVTTGTLIESNALLLVMGKSIQIDSVG